SSYRLRGEGQNEGRASVLSRDSLASQRICSRALVMGTGARARRRISESFRILPSPSGKAFSFLPFPLPFPSESFPFFPGFVSFQGVAGQWKRKKKKSRLLRADPEQGRRKWRAPQRSRLAGTRSEAGHADVLEVHRNNSTASFDFVKTLLRPGWSGCSFPKGGAGAGVRRVAVVGSAPDRTSVSRPTHALLAACRTEVLESSGGRDQLRQQRDDRRQLYINQRSLPSNRPPSAPNGRTGGLERGVWVAFRRAAPASGFRRERGRTFA